LGPSSSRHRPAIALADLIIAATAEELGADLATGNVRHFPMFPELQPPY
jgi:predicted nucleic acid-binding protein